MSKGEPRDDARRLSAKASEDEAAVRALLEASEVSDPIVGFHAQQAVEKLIKSALAHEGIAYPRTHDIAHLIDLLREAGVEPKIPVEDAIDLTGWGALFRYNDPIDEKLDRFAALETVEAVRRWVEGRLA